MAEKRGHKWMRQNTLLRNKIRKNVELVIQLHAPATMPLYLYALQHSVIVSVHFQWMSDINIKRSIALYRLRRNVSQHFAGA